MSIGRRRHELTPERRELIERTLRKRGRAATALMLNESRRVVQQVAESMGVRARPTKATVVWTEAADEHVFRRQSVDPEQLIAELAMVDGHLRTAEQIQERVRELHRRSMLELGMCFVEVARLIGRSVEFVMAEIERKRLRCCTDRESGRRYVFPSDLKRYVEGDFDRVDWLKCERYSLIDLLRGRWGVSDEQRRSPERKAAKKARRA